MRTFKLAMFSLLINNTIGASGRRSRLGDANQVLVGGSPPRRSSDQFQAAPRRVDRRSGASRWSGYRSSAPSNKTPNKASASNYLNLLARQGGQPPSWRSSGRRPKRKKFTAAKFETSRRREVLSFSHHREGASLPAAEVDALLDWCEEAIGTTDGGQAAIRHGLGTCAR
ncbi:MAG: hypothetical protein JO366_06505 [Methylobacteriaceae bacterium]|nr:hypothetical protein [Methylobacteriaceae bacterium]